ncbi:hypothetical protein V6N13_013769 [Hibiscus sabdariffa]|uniref:Uncharacterized protein n=2 Tax=Hibiscus sabdariffa TaxID=183260 RepID=A0ABR2P361_9ROSI
MEEEHEFKYVCKFCPKSFPCGRSLGGHTRSHMNNSAETDGKFIKKKLDRDINGGYILRQKPKKTWRRLSLFGHVKCKSSDKENQDSRTKRRTRYKVKYNKVVPANSSPKSETEQEEVALSLMMLSRVRDLGQWVAMNETCGNLESATMEKSSKRKFHCSGCNKKFLSHQALGGHKRNNGGCTENGELVEEDESGGHKRLTEARPKIHEFLDLNLPAPADEDETTAHAQCWLESSHSHKHKALVA